MLKIENIRKVFNPGTINEKVALDGVNLTLEEGEFVTVIGGNGAGKSTTLNAVAGVWPVDSGKIYIGGEDVTKLSEHRRAQYLGRVFQDPMTGTATTMSIEENMAIAARRGKSRGLRWGITKAEREKYRQMLSTLHLGLEDRLTSKVGLLSGGQRQRIGLARAMVMEPELVVADEPISALDVSIRAQVLNLLKKFQREKDLTYLFIAHDLSIVRFISDRIAVIYKGDIVEIADAEELFNFPLHPYTHSLISAIPIPDPQLEKNKVLFTYDPSIHDYSTDKPELVCIGHDHWVFGNKKEIEEYKATREKNVPLKTITILDKDAPRPEEHHDNIAHDEIQLPPLHDTGSAWYALLSFLLPVIGIIAAMIFKKHRHYRNYKMCKKGAIAGFIVLAVILALFLLALAAVFI